MSRVTGLSEFFNDLGQAAQQIIIAEDIYDVGVFPFDELEIEKLRQ